MTRLILTGFTTSFNCVIAYCTETRAGIMTWHWLLPPLTARRHGSTMLPSALNSMVPRRELTRRTQDGAGVGAMTGISLPTTGGIVLMFNSVAREEPGLGMGEDERGDATGIRRC